MLTYEEATAIIERDDLNWMDDIIHITVSLTDALVERGYEYGEAFSLANDMARSWAGELT